MIRIALADPGTARVKFNYNLYKIFRSEIRVLYYNRTWKYYWCYKLLPLIVKGTYRAYSNNDYYEIADEDQLYMYVPEYFLELFTDVERC
jgi:hypothetical protein